MLTLFRTGRAAAVVLVVLAALTLGACGDNDEDAAATTSTTTTSATQSTVTQPTGQPAPTRPSVRTETFEVAAGAVAGGARRIEAKAGEVLRLIVRGDVTDEAHLHGYDIRADIAPGSDGVLDVTADIPGVFEFELEDSGLRLGELEVR